MVLKDFFGRFIRGEAWRLPHGFSCRDRTALLRRGRSFIVMVMCVFDAFV